MSEPRHAETASDWAANGRPPRGRVRDRAGLAAADQVSVKSGDSAGRLLIVRGEGARLSPSSDGDLPGTDSTGPIYLISPRVGHRLSPARTACRSRLDTDDEYVR